MRRLYILAGASAGAVALLATAFAASAAPDAPAGDTAAATVDRTAQAAGADEFVVAYEGDAADATAAVEAAGGQVIDVNEQIGIALVSSDAAGFVDTVQASDAVTAAARNHSVGTSRPGQPHRFAQERPTAEPAARAGASAAATAPSTEPLTDRQWDMDQINAPEAHATATGAGVTVGIIDTGVDAAHPDIAPNFDAGLSRNFTMDIPSIDGACETPTCIDPANVDEGGHGTHVAGIVAADDNGIGTTGVAPDATIVNVRAGQDSGYFFLFETVSALTYAADAGLDVVNMSFYTDPWLYNCDSRDDYIAGRVKDADIAEQALVKSAITAALEYAHAHGVTMVAAAGNQATDLAAEVRQDATSPDYPPGSEFRRKVTRDCLDLPSEGPHVIQVSSLGPSGSKSDFSNYGLGDIDVAAPGGWFRDFIGTPQFQVPANMVLSTYPRDVAIAEGLLDANGVPVSDDTLIGCDATGANCGVYTYLQGTSMASPHVAGVAALVVQAHGEGSVDAGFALAPDSVRQVIETTATDTTCPAGVVDYTDEGRPRSWNAVCEGPPADNGFYGEGIVNAAAAVQ
jgi:subtilisin family serine protease